MSPECCSVVLSHVEYCPLPLAQHSDQYNLLQKGGQVFYGRTLLPLKYFIQWGLCLCTGGGGGVFKTAFHWQLKMDKPVQLLEYIQKS